jgi:hypothetical protein
MKNYLISSELLQNVIKYMFTRPYGEVHTLITGLAQLQETSNESGQKQETKKVWFCSKPN